MSQENLLSFLCLIVPRDWKEKGVVFIDEKGEEKVIGTLRYEYDQIKKCFLMCGHEQPNLKWDNLADAIHRNVETMVDLFEKNQSSKIIDGLPVFNDDGSPMCKEDEEIAKNEMKILREEENKKLKEKEEEIKKELRKAGGLEKVEKQQEGYDQGWLNNAAVKELKGEMEEDDEEKQRKFLLNDSINRLECFLDKENYQSTSMALFDTKQILNWLTELAQKREEVKNFQNGDVVY